MPDDVCVLADDDATQDVVLQQDVDVDGVVIEGDVAYAVVAQDCVTDSVVIGDVVDTEWCYTGRGQ